MSVAKGEIMKIYNQEKTEIIENPDLEKGYLKDDTRVVRIVPESIEVPEQFHYEYTDYKNEKGEVYGRDRKKVIDQPYQPHIPMHEETEDIKVYIPYTEQELLERKKQELRNWREKYFNIIDRATWFDSLTDEEKAEVHTFRKALLDITIALEYPEIPECVLSQIKGE